MSLFVSAKERKRQDREYARRIFPHGEAQREQETALLRQLIASDVSDNERIYHLIQLRDLLQTEDEPDELLVGVKKWYGSRYACGLTTEERARVYALALLTAQVPEPEAYPTVEEISQKARELLAGPMADWPEKQVRARVFNWGKRK